MLTVSYKNNLTRLLVRLSNSIYTAPKRARTLALINCRRLGGQLKCKTRGRLYVSQPWGDVNNDVEEASIFRSHSLR